LICNNCVYFAVSSGLNWFTNLSRIIYIWKFEIHYFGK
jgi:hypothetical protein